MRKRLGAETLATLFFFVAGIATPRAGFVAHSHSGGDHEHVHLDDAAGNGADAEIDRLLADALGSEAHHHHHHHPTPSPGAQAGIENPDAPTTWHWHSQSPFHRAITSSALSLAVRILSLEAPEPAPFSPPATAAVASQARAPPPVA